MIKYTNKNLAILAAACAALRESANKIEIRVEGAERALSVLDAARNLINSEMLDIELIESGYVAREAYRKQSQALSNMIGQP